MNKIDDTKFFAEIDKSLEESIVFVDKMAAKIRKENKAGFNPNQTRNEDGTWGNEGGSGDLSSWSNLNINQEIDDHYSDMEDQGSTFDPITGENLAGSKNSFSVSINPELTFNPDIIGENLTSENLTAYLENNKDIFLEGNTAVGTWYGSEPGGASELWLDVATIVQGRDEAIKLAIENNQVAIFDLENMRPIQTGGTGKSRDMNTKDKKQDKAAWADYMRTIMASRRAKK
jgi:hypothetical protein